jgi:hypothetical protein
MFAFSFVYSSLFALDRYIREQGDTVVGKGYASDSRRRFAVTFVRRYESCAGMERQFWKDLMITRTTFSWMYHLRRRR